MNQTYILAVKPGALLENICFVNETNIVDYSNTSITQNTSVSYPIHHIKNIASPSIGKKNPKIFFF